MKISRGASLWGAPGVSRNRWLCPSERGVLSLWHVGARGSELHHSHNTLVFSANAETELIPPGNPGEQGPLEVKLGLQAGDHGCL